MAFLVSSSVYTAWSYHSTGTSEKVFLQGKKTEQSTALLGP